METPEGRSRDAEIEARLAMVAARTNAQLGEVDRDVLRERLGSSIDERQQMRMLSLENQDEPAPGFDPGQFLGRPPAEESP